MNICATGRPPYTKLIVILHQKAGSHDFMNTAGGVFDLIIAGSGGSGLSLAYYLHQEGVLGQQKVLMLDVSHKRVNDRTWSFWYKGTPPFASILHKTYTKAVFESPRLQKTLSLAPYEYHVLRGIDFYNHVHTALQNIPNLVWQEARINSLEEIDGIVNAVTDKGTFRARMCFNSIYEENRKLPEKFVHLQQHFSGWVIETPRDCFTADTFTIHDFTIPQNGLHRFIYVLPYSANSALVEYTVFSEALLQRDEYDHALRDYITEKLGIEEYRVTEKEFGVIPMTDYPFPLGNGGAIHNIGKPGGAAKGSTGYAFTRIQKQTSRIAEQISKGTFRGLTAVTPPLYQLMDSVMLRVLKEDGGRGERIFSELFRKNSAETILTFLDEQSPPADLLGITLSMPFKSSFIKHFSAAVFDKFFRRR